MSDYGKPSFTVLVEVMGA